MPGLYNLTLGTANSELGWLFPSAAKAISKCRERAGLLMFSLLDVFVAAKTNY